MPSQNSTGGKTSLGRLTKRGDDYLRTLLIQGAKSAVMTAGKRSDRISQWLLRLKERLDRQKAAVALANTRFPTRTPGRALEDALHRPDRRQVNSITPQCLGARERMEPCRAIRIWGPDRQCRHKPACRCAVCPSMVTSTMRCLFNDEGDKYR